MTRLAIAAALILAPSVAACGQGPPPRIIPLKHTTTWVGNSFAGAGENGTGSWVQNAADEIEVTPDGTVFVGIGWDEGGRCAGLYKDGRVNRVVLKEHDGKGRESAWGWGTANNAVATWGEHLYLANLGKKLLRFRWTPGDIESARFVEEVGLDGEAVGLVARGDRLVVLYANAIETRRASDLAATGRAPLEGAKDAAVAADGSLWVLAGDAIRHASADGKDLGAALAGPEKPSALSIDPKGGLLVCDDGRRQQVLIYDVADAGNPRLVSAFGDEGAFGPGRRAGSGPRSCSASGGPGPTPPATSTSRWAWPASRPATWSSGRSRPTAGPGGSFRPWRSSTPSGSTRPPTGRSSTAGRRSSTSTWPGPGPEPSGPSGRSPSTTRPTPTRSGPGSAARSWSATRRAGG